MVNLISHLSILMYIFYIVIFLAGCLTVKNWWGKVSHKNEFVTDLIMIIDEELTIL